MKNLVKIVLTRTIDARLFIVPAAPVGEGTGIRGSGGDLPAGTATVRDYGSDSSFRINSASAAGDTVSWNQLGVCAPPLPSSAGLTGGSDAATRREAANKEVQLEGRWTCPYINNAPTPYTAARDDRVTFTPSAAPGCTAIT
jgi:hypothetical protein